MAEVIWTCKIGADINSAKLPPGAEAKLRKAVEKAFHEVVHMEADFIFSGFGGKLDPVEREIVTEETRRIVGELAKAAAGGSDV